MSRANLAPWMVPQCMLTHVQSRRAQPFLVAQHFSDLNLVYSFHPTSVTVLQHNTKFSIQIAQSRQTLICSCKNFIFLFLLYRYGEISHW